MNTTTFLRRVALCLMLASLLAACQGGADKPESDLASKRANIAKGPLSPEATRIKAHITYLADDRLEGREAGEPGYELAVDYIEKQFTALGLVPGGDNGTWRQEVPLRSFKLDREKAKMSLVRDGKTTKLEFLDDYLVRSPRRQASSDVSAELVFVGYGLIAPDYDINDYAGLDVEGKIVVALGGIPQGIFPSEQAAHFGNAKAEIAASQGAVGYVTVYSEALKKRYPWRRAKRSVDRTGVTWVQKNGQAFSATPNIVLTAFMNPKATDILFEGAQMSYADVLAASAKKGDRPKGFPLKGRLNLQGGAIFDDALSYNVAGVLAGSDPDLKDEYVVLTAHLDHIGLTKNIDPDADKVNNGAMDNASGVATLLEVARRMSGEAKQGKGPRRSIIFLMVTAEEKGLIGSQYFAKNPTVPEQALVANVNLDMALLLYSFSDVIAFGADHSSLGPLVGAAVAEMGVALIEDPLPEQSIFTRSDHYSFVQQGIPAVFLWPGFGNGGEEIIQDFLKTHYHSPSDDLNLPIDYEQGARFARLNYLVASAIADGEDRPTWNKDDFFGNLYGRK